VLPGFRTPAESSLKGMPRAAAGADVFLSVCGLLSSGARTVLLSRWRTGGQSSLDLVREFMQELPRTTPADAWQRAVMVIAESPLDLDAEPRIKKTAGDQPPKGNHPFFWSGYILVDSGVAAEAAEGEAPKQPKPKEPGKGDAKPAAEDPKKADGNQAKKPADAAPKAPADGAPKMPPDVRQPVNPAEAQNPVPPDGIKAPKSSRSKGRTKVPAKKEKAS